MALAIHGRARYTETLDVWVRRSEEKMRKLEAALMEFGFPIDPAQLSEFCSTNRSMIILGAKPFSVDLLNFLTGCEFEGSWERRVTGNPVGVEAQVISREDFVASKRAAGRPKDLLDLENLKEAEEAGGDPR